MADVINNKQLRGIFKKDIDLCVGEFHSFVNSKVGTLVSPSQLPTPSEEEFMTRYIINDAIYTCVEDSPGHFVWKIRVIPSKTSDLDNDSGFITISDLPEIEGGGITELQLNSAMSAHDASETAHAARFDLKVGKVAGKGLSENDFTTPLKTKLEGINADINNAINSHNASNSAHEDIRTLANDAKVIAQGKSRAIVFDTLAQLDVWLAVPANVAILQIGDNFFIRDLGVSDFWWDGTQKRALEGEKVDLTNIYTKAEADAKFLQIINLSSSPINFTESASRINIATGDTLAVLFGKIRKFFADLGALAFKSKVDYLTDIENLPEIDGGGMSFVDNENLTSATNFSPELNTVYHFQQPLTNLSFAAIPQSFTKTIVLFFKSGAAATSVVFPAGTKFLKGNAKTDRINTSYEMSIINGLVRISETE